MVEKKKIWLKFKQGFKAGYQYQDRSGFVWLEGHERELDAEDAEFLLKNFPNNFYTPPPTAPVAKSATKVPKKTSTK